MLIKSFQGIRKSFSRNIFMKRNMENTLKWVDKKSYSSNRNFCLESLTRSYWLTHYIYLKLYDLWTACFNTMVIGFQSKTWCWYCRNVACLISHVLLLGWVQWYFVLSSHCHLPSAFFAVFWNRYLVLLIGKIHVMKHQIGELLKANNQA